jgi:hypothetical protein
MLIHDEENDYTLPDNEQSCWITVDNLSIYIVRKTTGVLIEINNLTDTDYNILQKTFTPFNQDFYS